MTESTKIRVYLLDDHEVVRQGLRPCSSAPSDIEVVGESGSAAEATARIPALRPDVAVLDARLPDGSGIEVCRTVRAVDPTIRALILTSYDDDEALFAAIMAGASGYMLKEIKGSDLVERDPPGGRRQVADRPDPDRARARAGPQRPGDRARAGRPHRAGAQAARLHRARG